MKALRRLPRVDPDAPVGEQPLTGVLLPLNRDRLAVGTLGTVGANEHLIAAHGDDHVRLASDRPDRLTDKTLKVYSKHRTGQA
jgi:hypothetical protein